MRSARPRVETGDAPAPAAESAAAPAASASAPPATPVVDVSDAAAATPPVSAAAPPVAEGKGNEVDKKVRALKKKLKAIEELEAKAATGVELNEDQKGKIAAKGELKAEITKWESFSEPEELSKEVKKLGKKMRQIEELEQKAATGAELNEDQQGKIAAKEKLAEEMKKLEGLLKSL